jgi:tight adherence protein C
MSSSSIAVVLGAVGTVLVVVARLSRAHAAPRAIRIAVEGTPAPDTRSTPVGASDRSGRALRDVLARRVGRPLRPTRGDGRVERDLVLAGLAARVRAEEVFAAQAIGAAAGAISAVAIFATTGIGDRMGFGLLALLVGAGASAPRSLLRRRVLQRQRQVDARVSDALDLMTMCVESGLAFDAALATVGEAIPAPLGSELSHALAEIGLGLSRAEALDNLRRRNDSPALDAFVVAVLQADELGTPVGRVLAHQATEARARRRQVARERAAKLPVRILIPTVLLVFPPTFVILLAPAFASIRGAF